MQAAGIMQLPSLVYRVSSSRQLVKMARGTSRRVVDAAPAMYRHAIMNYTRRAANWANLGVIAGASVQLKQGPT